MNTVNIGKLGNIAINALGLDEFTKEQIIDSLEAQDYLCMNSDFESEEDLAELIIKHSDDEFEWTYEYDMTDCCYAFCTEIDGWCVQFLLWFDDIADELDMEFDGEGIPGDEDYDVEYFKRMRKVIEGE